MVFALVCMYVVRCALRSHQWRSEQSLFASALTVCPLNAKVRSFFLLLFSMCIEIAFGHM